MAKYAWIFAIVCFFVISAFATEDDVLVLTKDNFDSIKTDDLVLVEFYAPWCGHCKKLAPEYAEAAGVLKANDPPVKLAKVDATIETDLASKYSITSYPTMKIFRKGTVGEYKGPRDAKGIISYMQKQVGPSAKPIATADDLRKFLDHHDISVVGYFPTKNAAAEIFLQVADALREDMRMAYVSDDKVVAEFNVGSGVLIFHPKDNKPRVYSGSYETTALTEWIYKNSLPLVAEYNKNNQNRFKKANLPILKVFFDVDFVNNVKQTNYYINRIRKVAENPAYDNKIIFAYAHKKDFNDEVQKFGLDSNTEVTYGLDDQPKSLKYRLGEAFSVAALKKLADEYLAGTIEPYIKSQVVPQSNDQPVKVVVGKSFQDIVMDPTKDVLFEMYAPWCGHCKKLEPIYNELAEKVKNVENLVIAKMDATENDSPHPNYQATKGYPTILFAPANNKENPIPYQGPREVKDLYNFLKNKANSWKEK